MWTQKIRWFFTQVDNFHFCIIIWNGNHINITDIFIKALFSIILYERAVICKPKGRLNVIY